MRRLLLVAFFALLLCELALAVPFWGAKTSSPADTDPSALQPGEFVWDAAAVPSGPIVVVVSLTEQRAYVYRNGLRIGVTTVSTGKPGHRTPTGVFVVLQKDADHHSKKYDNAAMPFTERLTWDGVALHAGGLPGYPSSHGCIHLPSEFAQALFEISPMGMTVVVAEEGEAPTDVAHPAAIAPVDVTSGSENELPRLAGGEGQRWQPERSPQGPLSILMSGADRRVIVFRNGVEIGRARIEIRDAATPLGTHAFILQEGDGEGQSRFDPSRGAKRWTAVGIRDYAGEDARPLDPKSADRISMPARFGKEVYALLTPGTTLFVTDASVLEQTTGKNLNVINADPPTPE